MILTAIELENFKGISERTRIELRPITLLFGPNSAGKSTILHALQYADEILNRLNLDPDSTESGGSTIDLGGFKTLVHNHDLSRNIVIGLEIKLGDEKIPSSGFVQSFSESDGAGLRPLMRLTIDELKGHTRLNRGNPAELFAVITELTSRKTTKAKHLKEEIEKQILALRDQAWNEDDWKEVIEKVDTAFIRLAIGYDSVLERPTVKYYEVELNGCPVARIDEGPGAGCYIIANLSHLLMRMGWEDTPAINLEISRKLGGLVSARQEVAKASRNLLVAIVQLDDPTTPIAGKLYNFIKRLQNNNVLRDDLTTLREWQVLSLEHKTLMAELHENDEQRTEDEPLMEALKAVDSTCQVMIILLENFGSSDHCFSEIFTASTFTRPESALPSWDRPLAIDPVDLKVRDLVQDYGGRLMQDFRGRDEHEGPQLCDDLEYIHVMVPAEEVHIPESDDPDLEEARAALAGEFEGQVVACRISLPTPELKYRLNCFLVGVGKLFARLVSEVRYIGPIREIPERNFKPAKSTSRGRWASGIAAYDLLYSNPPRHEDDPIPSPIPNVRNFFSPTLIETVGRWLEEEDRLNSGYALRLHETLTLTSNSPLLDTLDDFIGTGGGMGFEGPYFANEKEVQADYGKLHRDSQLFLEDIRPGSSGVPLHIRDVGVGISQVLPIIAAVLDPNRPSLTSIDGPELHLHPGFQVRVGELFASQVRSNTKGIFLLETHSEHIILRLQRRIRETASDDGQPEHELHADDVAVTYMHSNEDGTVTATRLRMDNKGKFLDNWPHGFFEESFDELFPNR